MIRELKTFIAVAREGTFAAAGDRIGLTQAAVSAQMQRLEQHLGHPLFERTGRAARINAQGRETLAQAQELVRLYDGLGAAVAEAAGATQIHVGAITSVQRTLLPIALARLRRRRPQVRVRVTPGVSMRLLDAVDASDLDLAVLIRPPFPPHRDLRWTTLVQEPFRLLVPRHLTGEDWAALLSSQPFIRYDRTSFGGRQVDRFLRSQRIAVQEACELDEPDAIVSLVAQSVGVALVPQSAAYRRWPAGVRAIDLGDATFHREIGLIHRAEGLLPEAAGELASEVVRCYAGR